MRNNNLGAERVAYPPHIVYILVMEATQHKGEDSMTIDYTQLKAPISRKALITSAKLLNALIDLQVTDGRITEEAAEDIKMETVYHLHQAIEEGQRDIWYAVQEEEYRRSNFAV